MNRAQLIDSIWADSNLQITKRQVSILFDTMLYTIQEELSQGESVKIRGLGTFVPYKSKPISKKLPGEKNLKEFPGKNKVKFIPSPSLLSPSSTANT